MLGGDPVQHREVQGYESELFLSYFAASGGIRILEGGVESGFNKVSPETYRPRLLWLKGRKNIRIEEIPIDPSKMNQGDVFILDAGLHIYQWQGVSAGMNEKARAGQLCRAIDDERRGKPEVRVYSSGDRDELEFWKALLGPDTKTIPEIQKDAPGDAEWESVSEKRLYQLSDASGELTFKMVAEKKIPKSKLDSNDVFIFDMGNEVFVWIGSKASDGERTNAMQFAGVYLKKHGRPAFLPITRILDGGDNNTFNSSFDRE